MDPNLRDQQVNIDCYMQKLLYTNLMVTTNEKPVIDTQKSRTESKYITKENQQTMREESKRRKEQKD